MPKGEAMGRIVPVRFAPDALKAMEAAAKSSKKSLSEWIRGTLNAALSE
jgi:predicted HicB family RNase H-like nuclease